MIMEYIELLKAKKTIIYYCAQQDISIGYNIQTKCSNKTMKKHENEIN